MSSSEEQRSGGARTSQFGQMIRSVQPSINLLLNPEKHPGVARHLLSATILGATHTAWRVFLVPFRHMLMGAGDSILCLFRPRFFSSLFFSFLFNHLTLHSSLLLPLPLPLPRSRPRPLSLTHSPTHPPTHSPTHSPTRPLTPSPTHPSTHPHVHPLTHSLTHSLTPFCSCAVINLCHRGDLQAFEAAVDCGGLAAVITASSRTVLTLNSALCDTLLSCGPAL